MNRVAAENTTRYDTITRSRDAAITPNAAISSVAMPSHNSAWRPKPCSAPAPAPNHNEDTRSVAYNPTLVMMANNAATAAGARE